MAECSLQEIEATEREQGFEFDYIRFSLADLHGILRSFVVTRKSLGAFLKDGISLFSGFFSWGPIGQVTFVKQLREKYFGNIRLVPMSRTLHLLAWAGQGGSRSRRVGEIFCEGQWLSPGKAGSFMQACSRTALRKQLDHLSQLGLVIKSAFELEFSLLEAKRLKSVLNHATPLCDVENLLFEIMEACAASGVQLSNYLLEDTSGQFEFNLQPTEGIQACDDVLVVKQAIKDVSASKGYLASFMTKPCQEVVSNSFHLNLSLWTRTHAGELTNAFLDSQAEEGMSNLFRNFLAGLLKHAKALTALMCPTSNCYRRMHVNMCPHTSDWNFEDRYVTFRVKGCPGSPFLENRLPSSACNVYLATAATLAAGLDGIKNKSVLPEPSKVMHLKSPMEDWQTRKHDDKRLLPYTLEEALQELQGDQALKEALGEELVEWFVQCKRSHELPTADDWETERKLYLHTV